VANRDIVVIGASAGGLAALSAIVRRWPRNLPASVFVVIHTAPQSPGYLADILTRLGSLRARYAADGELFAPGVIYIAPADHHLLIEPAQTMRVVRGPRENWARPAIDPLFRSAALGFGRRVIGVVLSGGLDDGTAGLRAIKLCGGTTAVQDPHDAAVSSMPRSAALNVRIDHCAPAEALGPLLEQLIATPVLTIQGQGEPAMRKHIEREHEIANGRGGEAIADLGPPSLFTCPECHGALVKLRDQHPLRFRCHTGHAFTAVSRLTRRSGTRCALCRRARCF
jgi:two-component system chemotaxis response regulator CheB